MSTNELEDIRKHLRLAQETEPCGLRYLQELTGVSFSTLSRILRGADPDMKTLRKLRAFKSGEAEPKPKPMMTKRFTIGDRIFLVEIRDITEEK